MAGPVAQQLEDEQVQSSLIPAGRENDYLELNAPSVSFLDMVIDEDKMYVAPLAITNGSEDRDGEVTDPNGMIDVAYKSNPIVFLQHSHRVAPMVPPVGTAETPERVYDVKRIGDSWFSGCRFSQSTKFATQVFAMVADGLIRGRSIGALNHALSPYRPKLPGVAFHQNQIIPVRTKSVSHDQYELVEWSWVYIPSNRDMVTPLKSIISKGWIDGRPLDDSLKMIMKSFDLREPASSAKHMTRKPRFNWTPTGGNAVPTNKSPSAVLFDADKFSVPEVKAFMVKNADLGLMDTPIDSVTIDGALYLRSTQFTHTGEFETVTNPVAPGLKLLFAKALPTEEENPAGDATAKIEQLVADPAAGNVAVVEKPVAPAEAAAPAKAAPVAAPVAAPEGSPEEEATEGTAVENTEAAEAIEEAAGPGGMKYLKALIKNATQLADMAEAASADQEPEMMEKCGEYTSTLRSFIGKVSEFMDERYGKKKDGEAAPAEEKEEPSATLTKATQRGLFYGNKQLLSEPIVRGLQLLQENVPDERHRSMIGLMLKGVALPEATPDPEKVARDKVRAMIAQVKARESVKQLV